MDSDAKTGDSRPLVAIVGPTASGKSGLAMQLAASVAGGEIVSCDSVQIYRGFKIGCAKPTAAEQEQVPHHLIDVADWTEDFDAGRYRALAERAIQQVRGRGAVPILCGGTGLYLRVLRWGLIETPPADEALRARLRQDEANQSGVLYERLSRVDPATAQTTEPHNMVHVVRALEIFEKTGEPASAIRARHGFGKEHVPMRVVLLSWPREVLRARIQARTQSMLEQGLLDEVGRLLDAGVSAEARPMRSVGYREAVAVVRDGAPHARLAAAIEKSTRDYAKRQRTWFRKERDIEVHEVTSDRDLVLLSEKLRRDLS